MSVGLVTTVAATVGGELTTLVRLVVARAFLCVSETTREMLARIPTRLARRANNQLLSVLDFRHMRMNIYTGRVRYKYGAEILIFTSFLIHFPV